MNSSCKVMRLIEKYPDLRDIKSLCKTRVPSFVWEYFDSATGREGMTKVNRQAFDDIRLDASILHGDIDVSISKSLLGERYRLPFGVAPVGMSGLIKPRAESILCSTGRQSQIPYCLSTVASKSPESLAEETEGAPFWFQLYTPRDISILKDLLTRVRACGVHTLVVTLDLPHASVRERQLRAGLRIPPEFSIDVILQCLRKPKWSLERLANGMPQLETLVPYSTDTGAGSTDHIGYRMRVSPDEDYLETVRDLWPGKLIVKGITNSQKLNLLSQLGADAIWVSNHAGRQFDSGKPSIESLKEVRQSTPLPIIFDSGIETGLDIIKAYKSGADYVMLGRAWHYSLGAFGSIGPKILIEILKRDMIANMHQLGLRDLDFNSVSD